MPSVAIIGTRGYPSYYGGFETAVRKLAPFLADEGWDVTVYSRPGAVRHDDPHADPRITSTETWGINSLSLSTLTFGRSAVRSTVRTRADVALVMNVANGYWLPSLNRAGIPSLVNVDGIEWDRAKWGRAAKWVFRNGARLTAKHGTRMVYDSREIERRWAEGFGVGGDYIPYGGDVLQGSRPLESGLSHRGYVLVVARLVPENTVGEFFQAAPIIAKKAPVVIVGSTGYGGELDRVAEKLAATNDRIRWLRHVSDDERLHSLWQHAGLYFHGHSVGGTNPALVQAMASGAPTLARDTPYNREVLGNAGRYVTAEPSAIAKETVTLLENRDLLADMSKQGIERAIADYSWEMVCRRYSEALKKLIS